MKGQNLHFTGGLALYAVRRKGAGTQTAEGEKGVVNKSPPLRVFCRNRLGGTGSEVEKGAGL